MEKLDALSLPPGFGFHPTDTELVSHYLKRKILGFKNDSEHMEVIPVVDIYKHEPWDLPAKCHIPTRDSKWHFFALRDRKYPNGLRSNRATEAGYWKSTGKDRNVKSKDRTRAIGTKKTLVFHQGRPPNGKRTDWIMHEYYLNENEYKAASGMKDIFVICRVTKRNGFVSEDGEGRKVASKDGEMLTKTEVDFPDQPKVVDGTVVTKESSSTSDIDIDAWVNELLVTDFSIPCVDESVSQMKADITSIAREQEPLGHHFEQGTVDESAYLLPQDLQIILQSGSQDFNSEDIHSMLFDSHLLESDLHGMPYITDVDIASLAQFPPELLDDDLSSYASDVQEQTHEVSTIVDNAASGHSSSDTDSPFQIRPPHQTRKFTQTPQVLTQMPRKLRLKTSEMISRNSESVNHTVEFVNEKCRLALSEVDISARPVHSSECSSDTLCPTETEVPSKSMPAVTTTPNSHGAPAERCRQGSKGGMSLRGLRSAGLNCLFVGACIVGTAAPILYFMLRDARWFLANSAPVGF